MDISNELRDKVENYIQAKSIFDDQHKMFKKAQDQWEKAKFTYNNTEAAVYNHESIQTSSSIIYILVNNILLRITPRHNVELIDHQSLYL